MVLATPGRVPGVVVGLQGSIGDGKVTLTWSPPIDQGSSPVTSYNVYRGTSSVPIGNVTGTSYVDTGLTNGETYSYRVAAISSTGEGDITGVTITLPPPPEPPLPWTLIVASLVAVFLVGVGAGLLYMRKKK